MKLRLILSLLLLSFSATAFAQAPAPTYDLLIRNGKLIDGSGNPWTYADIGIVGDLFTIVPELEKLIDAARK